MSQADLETGLIVGQVTSNGQEERHRADILSGTFRLDGVRVRLSLSREGLEWKPIGATGRFCGCCKIKEGEVYVEDLLGVEAQPALVQWRNCCRVTTRGLLVSTYHHDSKAYQELYQQSYLFTSDEEDVDRWQQQIRTLMRAQPHRPTKLLVIVNPYGGRRRAKMLWATFAAPMMRMAGIECDVRETTHQRHAEEIVCSLNEAQTAELDGIVAVGGDGLFHEVVNGLLALRAARDGTPHAEVASSLRLGHIPAGSTDTVAYTLHGTRSLTTAAIRIVLGDRNPLDIARVDMLPSQTHTFAVSMISYGYLGDLMKESERLRRLGPLRYEVVGAKVLFSSRTYRAKVSYLANDAIDVNDTTYVVFDHSVVLFKHTTTPRADHAVHRAQGVCMANCMHCGYTAQMDVPAPADAGAETVKFTKAAKRVSLLDGNERVGWDIIEGEFRSIMVVVIPCRSNKSTRGVIQGSHLADGRMHLVLVHKCSNWQYLRFLLGISATGLAEGMFDFVEIKTVKAVQVRPIERESHWNCDGELLPENHISIRAHRGLVQVYSRGVDRWQALAQRRHHHRPRAPAPPAETPTGGSVELQSLNATAAAIRVASVTAPARVRQRVGLPGALAADPL